MKTGIHPDYKVVNFICGCGATFTAGSTLSEDFKTEICSQCHPFYTGKQKLVDTSGRVDKFMAKVKKAQSLASKNVKNVDKEEEKAEETPEEEAKAETTEEPKAEAAPEETAEAAEEAPAPEETKEEEKEA